MAIMGSQMRIPISSPLSAGADAATGGGGRGGPGGGATAAASPTGRTHPEGACAAAAAVTAPQAAVPAALLWPKAARTIQALGAADWAGAGGAAFAVDAAKSALVAAMAAIFISDERIFFTPAPANRYLSFKPNSTEIRPEFYTFRR